MKWFIRALMVVNVGCLGINNLLVFMGRIPRENFTIGAMVVVLISLYVTYMLHFRPNSISWFGNLLTSEHPANLVLSKIFCLVAIVPGTFFSIYPLSKLFWA